MLMTPGRVIPWREGEVVIRIMREGDIYVEKVTRDICWPPKRVTEQDLQKIWMNSYVFQQTYIEQDMGILPSGTVEYIPVSTAEKGGFVIVIEREKSIRPFKIGMDGQIHEFNIGYPRLLFRFFFLAGEFMSLHVRAVKGTKPVRKDTPLYSYPFSNVYSDGRACLGSYKYPPVKEPLNVETYPEVFFEMVNTIELHYPLGGNMPLSKLIEICRDREFDDNLLIPCGETYEAFARKGLMAFKSTSSQDN
jgi:hypothetical protein